MLNFQGKLDTVPKIMKAIGQMIIREGLLTPKVVQQVSDEYIRDGVQKNYTGQKSPWRKVCLKNCLLGQLSPWVMAPWTIVATTTYPIPIIFKLNF